MRTNLDENSPGRRSGDGYRFQVLRLDRAARSTGISYPYGKDLSMATYLVMLRRSGPRWNPTRPMEEQSDWLAHASYMDELVDAGVILLGGPLQDEQRVALAVVAESEDAVHAVLARDPWRETHLRVDSVELWTIQFDGRQASIRR